MHNDEKTLIEHSTDASIFKIIPKGVFFPEKVSDIVNIVKEVGEKGESISVRAGGTCMTGGSLTSGYILNMTKTMNKIEIDPEKRIAKVEMGAYFRDIESEALKHSLMFAPYPSSHLICGIGGMIGNNASGEKSLRFGATIDNIISLEVVLSDGTIIDTKNYKVPESIKDLYKKHAEHLKHSMGKVKKVASGYRLDRIYKDEKFDITPLFVGAQGTLGIVTKAVLKLVPIPEKTFLYLISVDSIHDIPFILKTVLNHNPESVETFDKNTFARAKVHMKEMADHIDRFFTPKTNALILAQFTEEVDLKEIKCEKISDPKIVEAAWKIRRSSYSLVRDHNEDGKRAVPCVEDSIVPIERFDAFVEGLVNAINKHKIEYAYHGHIADGALRIIPIFDFKDKDVSEKIISFTRDVIRLIKNLGGNMSADHSDGIIRTPFLKEFYGEELYRVFEEIKNIFDPKGILNPKKKVKGNEEDIKKYINYA